MCWGLAHAYGALFNTIQYPQREEKVSGSDDKMTGTVAIPPPVTGTVAPPTTATGTAATLTSVIGTAVTPTPVTGTAATPTPVTGIVAEPKNQPVLVSVDPIQKKKYTKKSVHIVKDNEPGPSREQEEEAEPEVIT
ncbi:microtubule-associated protein RP/EB family member 1-like [Grus japonensis]|uniref:Microtubule-associated protein RP/EB family member 1-like n=1 Tax=Grus japonensis TaxID=30415 RepID=A0ABC9YEH1_GRUJA